MMILIAGCGSDVEMATVTGTVTSGSDPVSNLQVTFEPVDGENGTAMGFTDDKGEYTLLFPGNKQGAPLGDYLVRLSVAENEEAEGGQPVEIPPAYGSDSQIKRTVVSGSNVFNFDLQSPPEQ